MLALSDPALKVTVGRCGLDGGTAAISFLASPPRHSRQHHPALNEGAIVDIGPQPTGLRSALAGLQRRNWRVIATQTAVRPQTHARAI
ncbi:hypothetical protein CHELA1G11_21187 [Hyphomicrobiales bacterium]|nr:hypothetical protein CHELA1G11_21187 [Hyphomicrobiales bacterium]CAH1693673.1 hypothetical protein CHELA1G2_21494 [Hyphomicrobiales bacterium]